MELGKSNKGYCLTCDSETEFVVKDEWLRDGYICGKCGSIPRERALMFILEKYYPNWKDCCVHESSPCNRGTSLKLRKMCKNYLASQFFPGYPLGSVHSSGFRNEDLGNQTFPDQSFDLVITQDVVEHLLDPEKVFSEIARVLKPGGAHIFSVPLVNATTEFRAKLVDGNIKFLLEPRYHGNPVDINGSLVAVDWGSDIVDYIYKSSGLITTINFVENIDLGIKAELIEILLSRKSE